MTPGGGGGKPPGSARPLLLGYLAVAAAAVLLVDAGTDLLVADPSLRGPLRLLGMLGVVAASIVLLHRAGSSEHRIITGGEPPPVLPPNHPDVLFEAEPGDPPRLTRIEGGTRALTGYDPRELLADPDRWRKVLHPEDRDRWDRLVRDANLDVSPSVPTLLRWISRQGAVRTGNVRAVAIREPGAGRVRVRGVIREASALDPSAPGPPGSTGLEGFVRRADAAFLLLGPEGDLRAAGPRAPELVDWQGSELEPGRPVRVPEGGLLLDALFAADPGVLHVQSVEGSPRSVELVPLLDDAGARPPTTEYLVLVRDGSRRASLEERIREAQRIDVLGPFAGGVSRELRDLLGGIVVQGEAARAALADGDPSEAERLLGGLEESARRGSAVVRRLLSLGESGGGGGRVLDPGALLEELRPRLRSLVRPSTRLEIHPAPGLPGLLADPGSVEEILGHLVRNAAEAVGEEGRIAVAAEPWAPLGAGEGGWGLLLSVSDDGAGMNPGVRRRIFEPFFTTRTRAGGVGLGLPRVRALVHEIGGTVSVESREGEGTTIRLLLPGVLSEGNMAHATPPGPGGEEAPPPGMPRGGRERLLVVDDETAIRATSSRILRGLGYTVLEATDGSAALSLLMGGGTSVEGGVAVDLVLTDVVMPRMGGPELVRRYREAGGRAPVLYMSGYDLGEIGDTLRLVEHAPFIEKPWTVADLARRIRALLDGPSPSASRTPPEAG
jgi:signal transduction histidine kinase/CheY-like chemotaxis protein